MQISTNSTENGPDGQNIIGDHVSVNHTDTDNKTEVNGSAHGGNYAELITVFLVCTLDFFPHTFSFVFQVCHFPY